MVIDPKISRKRRILVSLSDEEYEGVKSLADKWGVPVSGLIRLLIRKAQDGISFIKSKSR